MSRQCERRLNSAQQETIALAIRKLLCQMMLMAENGLLNTPPRNATGSTVLDTIASANKDNAGKKLSQYATPYYENAYTFAEDSFLEMFAILSGRNLYVQSFPLGEIRSGADPQPAGNLNRSQILEQCYDRNGVGNVEVPNEHDVTTIQLFNTSNHHFAPIPVGQNSKQAYRKEHGSTINNGLCLEASLARWFSEHGELSELEQLVTAEKLEQQFGVNIGIRTSRIAVSEALRLQQELTRTIHAVRTEQYQQLDDNADSSEYEDIIGHQLLDSVQRSASPSMSCSGDDDYSDGGVSHESLCGADEPQTLQQMAWELRTEYDQAERMSPTQKSIAMALGVAARELASQHPTMAEVLAAQRNRLAEFAQKKSAQDDHDSRSSSVATITDDNDNAPSPAEFARGGCGSEVDLSWRQRASIIACR